MENRSLIWSVYIGVALLTLFCKCLHYVYWGLKNRSNANLYKAGSIRFWYKFEFVFEMLTEWFFDKTKENAVSWIATVFVVWSMGYMFIERTPGFLAPVFGPIFNCLPVAVPGAGLLGWAAEMAAPNFAKWLVGKLSSPVGG